jgi:predicted DNA-binding transcriptional regulator AlpA
MLNVSSQKIDNLEVMRYRDLVERRIWNNRMSLRRAMLRVDDPFPRPIQLGPNSIAWRRRDVEEWLERRAKLGIKGVA